MGVTGRSSIARMQARETLEVLRCFLDGSWRCRVRGSRLLKIHRGVPGKTMLSQKQGRIVKSWRSSAPMKNLDLHFNVFWRAGT